MALNEKLVVRFQNGRVLKGISKDFSTNKDSFHLALINRPATNPAVVVSLGELKGIFFVKDFTGKKEYQEDKGFSKPGKTFYGKKTVVHFKDGEILYGFTQNYAHDRPGFFLYPYDSQSNNIKLFALRSYVTKVEFPPS
ncbi:MAG TPA: hypothetical protein VLY20_12455 [Nitrospiria bacterium]|nr:hypothetical protein [Nitrospiria bacterium]